MALFSPYNLCMDEAVRQKWHEARRRIQGMRAAMNKASTFGQREYLGVEVEKEEYRFRRSLTQEEVQQLDERLKELQSIPAESRQLSADEAVKSPDPMDNDEFYLLRRLLRGA